MLRDHITQRHPNRPFTFICTDDQTTKERLKDMLRRSTSHIHSTDVTHDTCLSVTGTSPNEIGSPFVITLSPSPQPKEEFVDIERSTTHSTITTSDRVVEIEKQTDIKPNLNVVHENFRCETCHESFPRNLIIIRDHVKMHFKEKTGCVPGDLTQLLPSLQQIYCQLLMTSFPSVGVSILNDDIPNCNQTTNHEETEDNGTMIQDKDNVQENSENDTVLADNDSMSSNSNGHHCEKCGRDFRRLTSLNAHLERWCKLNVGKEDSKSMTTYVSPIPVTGASHLVACDVHLNKRPYECSICETAVMPSTIAIHDTKFHGGIGKALVVNNLHRYKDQVEVLRKTLIVDRNSSLNSTNTQLGNSWELRMVKKLPLRNIPSLKPKSKGATKKRSTLKQNRHLSSKGSRNVAKFDRPLNDGISQRDSRNAAKLVEDKTESPNPFSCEICEGAFSSACAMKIHRAKKHGILVKWHCKECNINIETNYVPRHLLIVHLGKKNPGCSLCNSNTNCRKLASHDRHRHGGLGKAQVINNMDRYRKEIEELRNTLIIDINAMGKLENSPENNSTPQGKSQQSIPKLQLKSKNPVASESVQWMSRFKRSQKRKRIQKEVLPFKRFGDINATSKP